MTDELQEMFAQFEKKKEAKKPDEIKEETKKEVEAPVETKEVKTEDTKEPEPTPEPVKKDVKETIQDKPKEKTLGELFGSASDSDFDLSPAQPNPKHIITVFGLKGAGKTSFSFSFPESHGCLSFDNKSLPISEQMDKKDHIVVFNGARYLDKSSPDAYLSSSNRSWRYLNKILDTIHEGKVKDAKGNMVYDESKDTRPDWMVVDGGEIFQQIAEMVMRYNNNLQPYQGMSNLNLWKERNMYIDQLLLKCTAKSKKGVIWTTYIKQKEIIHQGSVELLEDRPKWIASVLRDTDVVIKVERSTTKQGQRFYATVETSKWDKIPESVKTDVTGNGIEVLSKGDL